MNVIVVGCGRVGSELAFRLYQQGHKVTVVDETASAFECLHPDFRGRTVQGEALNRDVLLRAGIEQADGLAAVTTSDSLNAVVAHAARTTFGLSNVVVRNYDPRRRSIHESFGAHLVSSAMWDAQRIDELLGQSELRTVFSTSQGDVGIHVATIPPAWQGRRLKDLLPGDGCLAVALTRAGQAALPAEDTCLEIDDLLYVSATAEGLRAFRERLARQQEEA